MKRIFLNFLLFNEAFLCINYAIAGLSAGSRRNAGLFGFLGILYLLGFSINLVYGAYIFKYLLDLVEVQDHVSYFPNGGDSILSRRPWCGSLEGRLRPGPAP